jgi:peptidoglycan biosynthesis protein MviN/MurJ (putative lipid II flippase)
LAAALVTGLTAVSAMPGFLRDIVIAGAFGAELDAYFGLAVLRPHHAGHDWH